MGADTAILAAQFLPRIFEYEHMAGIEDLDRIIECVA